jgi:hypothetical protein
VAVLVAAVPRGPAVLAVPVLPVPAPLVLADPLPGLAVGVRARAALRAGLVADLVVPAQLLAALLVRAQHLVVRAQHLAQVRLAAAELVGWAAAVLAAAVLLLRPSLQWLSAAVARSSPWPAKLRSSPVPRSR